MTISTHNKKMGQYRPGAQFAEKSNRKRNKKCKIHLFSYWGINPATNDYWDHCVLGNRLHEDCFPIDEEVEGETID